MDLIAKESVVRNYLKYNLRMKKWSVVFKKTSKSKYSRSEVTRSVWFQQKMMNDAIIACQQVTPFSPVPYWPDQHFSSARQPAFT